MSTRARTVSSRVDRAGGVVRVDDHQGVGVLGDLGLDVLEVGVPAVALVAAVVHRGAAGQRDRAGPQRVVGGRDEHLVAVVDERLQHHRDELGDAVADVDVVDAGVGQPVRLVVLRDRGAGGVDAAGVGVALAVGQVVDHVGDDRLGGLEPERRGVADVELEDLVALGLEPLGLDEDRAAHVVAHVLELLALDDAAHGASVPARRVGGARVRGDAPHGRRRPASGRRRSERSRQAPLMPLSSRKKMTSPSTAAAQRRWRRRRGCRVAGSPAPRPGSGTSPAGERAGSRP